MDPVFALSLILLSIGITGSLAGSLILPALGRLLHRPLSEYHPESHTVSPGGQPFSSLAILIPAPRAKSERAALVASCASINAAIELAKLRNPTLTAEIFIGIADPLDRTPRGIAGDVRWITTRKTKWWSMLAVLVERAWAYDWMAVVEPGTRWSPDVLVDVILQARQDRAIALISPLHGNHKGKATVLSKGISLARSLLAHPNHLSSIPMPFGPATTFFRSDELVSTFRELRAVGRPHGPLVIPFVMRALHPTARFVSTRSKGSTTIIPPTSTNATASGTGDRRFPVAVDCFHMLRSLQSRLPASLTVAAIEYLVVSGWVYWTSSTILGIALLFDPYIGLMATLAFLTSGLALAGISALLLRGADEGFVDEIICSLLVPLYILFPPVIR